MGAPFWDVENGYRGKLYADNPWATIILGSPASRQLPIQLPGLVEVERAGIVLKADQKSAAGRHGANVTTHGLDPQPVEIKVTIWTPEQLAKLEELLPQILPRAETRSPWPIDAAHPGLRLLGIKSIIILGASALRPGSVQGTREMTISARDWRPPGKKTQTVTRKGSKGQSNALTDAAFGSSGGGRGFEPANANFSLPSGDAVFTGPN